MTEHDVRESGQMSKPATMVQIAERAGVALSTVSYVLSGKRSVSPGDARARPGSRRRARLPPARGQPARSRAERRTRSPSSFLRRSWQILPVQQTFVAGATLATSASDYSLLLSTAATDPETIAQLVATGRADGVILMETLIDDPRVERLQAAGYPVRPDRAHA